MLATAIIRSWFYYFSVISGVGATWIGLYLKVIRPQNRQHEREKSDRDQKRRETDAFLYGVKPIDGVTEETLSAPRRLRAVELSIGTVLTRQSEVIAGQAKLEKRMDESNGTGRDTRKDVAEIKILLASMAGKPPTSVAEVKQAVTQDHEQIERRQTEILSVLREEES